MNEELRCKLCGKLLGKGLQLGGIVAIKCHRCGTITEFGNKIVHYIVRTEAGEELGLLTLKNKKI
ncbi:Com family DNA-binding transcriptional regulator [Patescibacteria group bacterium]|nr:Com family DNA-binding transcriptional regulator [Patescibacteria group bacterium]